MVKRKGPTAGPALVALALASSCPAPAAASELWFTVVGDAANERADTVQLNMADVAPRGMIQFMDLRVSLAAPRKTDGGEEFASYVSRISLDCKARSIVHVRQTRYPHPLWRGRATLEVFEGIRPTAFRWVTPSPNATILKAACLQ
jgi:hypothetical protein